MTVAISRIDDVEYNNTMHSDGQGRGIYSFYQVRCLIAIYKCPFTLPAGDGGRSVKNMKKRQNDFDDEDILDIVDVALKEAYINTDERLIIWPNGEKLTVDQSAEKINGENDLDDEVVKDCIMAWVEMDAQHENENKKQEEIFIEEIQNWVNDYYREKKLL